MNAIGGWVCNATWLFFKNQRFVITISLPYQKMIHIEAVKICPEYNEFQIIGTFTPNKMFDSNIRTDGSSCWKNEGRFTSDGNPRE